MLNLPYFYKTLAVDPISKHAYWSLNHPPAPLILIHSNSANTHRRGFAVTGPQETQGFYTSSETASVL